MDPHMTEGEDAYLQFSHHRRLHQRVAPASPLKTKKKTLVNFLRSSRRRLEKEDRERQGCSYNTDSLYMSTDIPLTPLGNELDNPRRGEMQQVTARKDMDERVLNRNFQDLERDNRYFNQSCEFRNLNEERRDNRSVKDRREDFKRIHERRSGSRISNERRGDILHKSEKPQDKMCSVNEDAKNHNVPRKETLENKNGNPLTGNGPSRQSFSLDTNSHARHAIPSEDNHGPMLNKITSATSSKNMNSNRPQRSSTTTTSQCFNQSVSWDLVRKMAVPEERTRAGKQEGNTKFVSVVELITRRRSSSVAPTIWTPAVSRSRPSPRPANFTEQEEPGRKTFIMTFITWSKPSRQKPLLCQRRQHQQQLYRVPTTHWEVSGKKYLAWLADLVDNPLFQDGQLLKGLEIGVQFPVVYLRESQGEGVGAAATAGKRMLVGSLGADSLVSQGVYEKVVSWLPELLMTCSSDPSLLAHCYIMIGFITLEGDLDKKMEHLWKEWTGALYIYCNVDDELGLKKFTFYRRRSAPKPNLFSYLVLVELVTVTKKNCIRLLDFVYRMKMRNMSGYISVYQRHYPEARVFMVPGGSPMSFRARSPVNLNSNNNTSSGDSYVDSNSIDLDRMTL